MQNNKTLFLNNGLSDNSRFIGEITKPAEPVNGQDERRICTAVDSSARSLLMGNQGGKALKWLPAHFNFYESVSASSGHFVPKSGARRGTRTFIYALSADETSPSLAAPRHAVAALFSCRFKCACPPRRQPHLRSNADRAYTHYTLQKSCAKGQAPLETPDNKTG